MAISGTTKVYGILGCPVSHSLSPVMHNAAFAQCDIDSVYIPFSVENVAEAVAGLKGLGIKGVSVTIPHKEAVIPYLDKVDPVAGRIGAVNTIVVSNDGKSTNLHGTNTDWIGANTALGDKITLKGRKAVILGAGGSARAIGFGLIEAGAEIGIFSRTEVRGRELAEVLGCGWQALSEVGAWDADILINATSVGMTPNDTSSPVPKEVLGNFKVVMDIVYSPLETKLLRDAASVGCKYINGLEMLLYQGVAQFELWTGKPAPVAVMRDALLRATGNNGS